MTERQIAALLMTAFAAFWALIEDGFVVRLRLPYDLTQIVWCRYAVHLVVVFLVWGLRDPARLVRTDRRLYHVGRAVMMLALPVGFNLAAFGGMPIGTVWSALWAAPTVMLLLSFLVLRERPTLVAIAATLIGFVGALLIVDPVPALPPRATAWAALMSGAFAVYVIMTRRLRTEELRTNLFYTGAGVFVPLTAYVPRVWLTPPPHDLVVFVAIGVFGFFALLTLDRAVERAEVSTSVSFVYLQLVFAAAISWRRQPHPITAQLLGGAALIAAAAALHWRQLAARTPEPLGAAQRSP